MGRGGGMEDIGPGRNERRPVNPYRPGQGEPTGHIAWLALRWQATVTQFRGRLEVGPFPGGRRSPGPDYTGRCRGWWMTFGEDKIGLVFKANIELKHVLNHANTKL